jgi:integrase
MAIRHITNIAYYQFFAQGAHPKAIQRRMGHSTINMTLDRYGHLFPELDRQVASDVGGILEKAASGASSAVRSIRTGNVRAQR